jgi:hypothetical protein
VDLPWQLIGEGASLLTRKTAFRLKISEALIAWLDRTYSIYSKRECFKTPHQVSAIGSKSDETCDAQLSHASGLGKVCFLSYSHMPNDLLSDKRMHNCVLFNTPILTAVKTN